MQLMPYLLRLTGQTYVSAFLTPPYLMRLEAGADNIPHITIWNTAVLGHPQPSDADIATIMAAAEYVPPPNPFATAPTIVAAALDLVVTPSLWDVSTVSGLFQVSGVTYAGVGVYMLFFADSQPDTDYFTIVTGGAPSMTIVDKTVDGFTVNAKGTSGVAVDPAIFSVQILRLSS